MKNKRLAALLLAGMLFFAQSISANAQVPFNVYQGTEGVTDISLQWTNVNDRFDFSDVKPCKLLHGLTLFSF